MDLRSESSSPYVFNTLKHHAAFIRGFVQKARYYDTERIHKELRIIGNSVIDLYIGDLSPIRITDEIGDLLKGRNCFDQKLYTAFLENRPKKIRNG